MPELRAVLTALLDQAVNILEDRNRDEEDEESDEGRSWQESALETASVVLSERLLLGRLILPHATSEAERLSEDDDGPSFGLAQGKSIFCLSLTVLMDEEDGDRREGDLLRRLSGRLLRASAGCLSDEELAAKMRSVLGATRDTSSGGDSRLGRQVSLLCLLSDRAYQSPEALFCEVDGEALFPRILQRGLACRDNATKKQSLYLLKRTLDECGMRKAELPLLLK